MAGERFPYQSSGERGRQAKAERGKEKREREGERIGGRMGGVMKQTSTPNEF